MSIIVIGSLNMDMVITSSKMPRIGETINGHNFMTAPGGKGANQSVAIGKLGGNVSQIGCVGNDSFGNELKNNLNNNGVNSSDIIVTNDESTGIAVIVLHDSDNFIILNRGANSKLTPTHIENAENNIAKFDTMILQLEIPIETVKRAIEIGKRNGLKIILNPAPASIIPDNFYESIDILIPNETEIETLTGIKINNDSDAENAINTLLNKGVKQVILTLGKKGIIFNEDGNFTRLDAFIVNAVDATSAGDSFIGGTAYKLDNGSTLKEATTFGMAVAAIAVTRHGAQPSLPSLNEVENFIQTSQKTL